MRSGLLAFGYSTVRVYPTLTTSTPACSARAIMSAVPRRREMFLRRFEIDYKLELSRRCTGCPRAPRRATGNQFVLSDLRFFRAATMRARHHLIGENFADGHTFAAGARCLLRLMDERECAFQQNVERNVA
jgi:hypothetical protein